MGLALASKRGQTFFNIPDFLIGPMSLQNGTDPAYFLAGNVVQTICGTTLCFHVYAQKSLFISENDNAFLGTLLRDIEFIIISILS